MVKIIIFVLLVWLFCSFCFFLGLSFASAKADKVCENKVLCNKHLYEVNIRCNQKDGFIKKVTVFADDEYDAIGESLKKQFTYDGITYSVYSIVSVNKLDKLEDCYYA